ncbi:hypothetical protein HMPREF0216_00319 [Clostridium celatum DSM 1785]|uniref:Uncharacterized protein n=1 Tax=Clostridium celatum DSM 1785 TaxID=545697 RepID=L1QNI6_9CLOT|nr:hypothetical protein HMPREF0216_00319 [Clostridium celatum DSM 1785]
MKNALLEVITQKVIEEIKSNNFNSIKNKLGLAFLQDIFIFLRSI